VAATGLDPRARAEVWELVRGLVADGTTVLLTTQYLEEADRLAAEVAVIDHGQVIERGTPAALKAKVGGQTLEVRPADRSQLDTVTAIVAEVQAPPRPATVMAGWSRHRCRAIVPAARP
jgi:oleandomycin transport system ATP-binding protein